MAIWRKSDSATIKNLEPYHFNIVTMKLRLGGLICSHLGRQTNLPINMYDAWSSLQLPYIRTVSLKYEKNYHWEYVYIMLDLL